MGILQRNIERSYDLRQCVHVDVEQKMIGRRCSEILEALQYIYIYIYGIYILFNVCVQDGHFFSKTMTIF